jgi:hypothetical protein
MQLHFAVIDGILYALVITNLDTEVSIMSSRLSSSPTEVIVAQVNNLGLQRAAKELNTSPSTLSRWLKVQHFKIKRIYVREEELQHDAQRN